MKKYLNNNCTSDLHGLLIGDKIGGGCSRQVYECRIDPTCVVKVEESAESFCNIIEWETWYQVQWVEDHKKWFAPCEYISPCGIFLIQKRAAPIKSGLQLPERIPNYFTDLCFENWGIYNNHPVCVDYGYNLLMTKGLTKRTVKAKWHND